VARTKGSGWGGGVLLYQMCPCCGRKKVIYRPMGEVPPFYCIRCKERFNSKILIRKTFASQLRNGI